MPQEIVFRGRLDTYTGFGQQFCPLVQFFIRSGFHVKVRATGLDESFTATVPAEIKSVAVEDVPQDNEWEFQFLPLAHPVTAAKKVIYFTMWETDTIGPAMVAILNSCRCVIVPCQWNADTFARCGVTVPIRVVPLGINKEPFRYRPPISRQLCVFGAAGRMGHGIARKGVPMVIEAFREAFGKKVTDVRLKVKVFTDCVKTGTIRDIGDKRILIEPKFMNEEGVGTWLGTLSAFVSAASGEGWGLWQHQSLAVGRPVIACEYGGMSEFLNSGNSFPLIYEEVNAGEHHAGYGKWAKPYFGSLVAQMRYVYNNRLEAETKGLQGSRDTAALTYENSHLAVLDAMREFGMLAKAKPIKPHVNVFRHSGDWGDIIFALPTIRALGGGILYITESHITRQKLTPERADKLAGLLRLCPYITDLRYGMPKEDIDYDLDTFREVWQVDPVHKPRLFECQAECWGLDGSVADEKWLFVDHPLPVIGKPVVICQTKRYENPDFPWGQVAEKYRNSAVFVGFEDEYNAFIKRYAWPELQRVQTRNFLEVARVIEGGKLFIGNQSGIHAVAEGLKKRMIHASCPWDPSCIVSRDGCDNFLEARELVLPEINEL